jgi:N-acetylglucosaminyldiphosphoundecaprenol N-acetyl-beta-D-mannosaminyltransferase
MPLEKRKFPSNSIKAKFVEVIGYKVFSDDLSLIPVENSTCKVINTISPNSYGVATKDDEFDQALKASDYLVLDGVYFAVASILLKGKNIKANQGPDVFYHFLKRLDEKKGRAFFLGSTPNTLEKIERNAKIKYPGITLDYYSPPFKPKFSDEDNNIMLERIKSFKPDVLFVGMTCPKQEKWAIKNRDGIEAGLALCIGNAFDWFAGTQKAIHPFWFKVKLGWFVRILLRPEIFKRNIGNQMKFFWHVIMIFLRIKETC